jgi:molybdate transport system substrate-binding protein
VSLITIAAGCSQPSSGAASTGAQSADEITVYAASSLTEAFTEIGGAYEASNAPGVVFNFGASSQLTTQLEQGAPADVFASADEIQMERARSAGLLAGPARVFARNRLVVAVSSRADLHDLHDLARPGIRLVTSQPEVPIGVYTRQALEAMSRDPSFGSDFLDRVTANVVSREANVRGILSKVQLGEADAGIVYSSDAVAARGSGVEVLAIPDRFNVLAAYPIAAVGGSPRPREAQAFIDFVLSPRGQDILQRWGFQPA